jgi:hypothetical protein
MAEIRTVTTLRYKRAEIETSITNYEKRLAQEGQGRFALHLVAEDRDGREINAERQLVAGE